MLGGGGTPGRSVSAAAMAAAASVACSSAGAGPAGAANDRDSGGGGGGGFSKGKGDPGALGGTTIELEREARAMIRKGEINPFELRTLATANALDYADAVITLLGTMKQDDPRRREGLEKIRTWIDKALANELAAASA